MPRIRPRRAWALATLALAVLLAPPGAARADDYEDALTRYHAHEYEESLIALKNALKAERDNLPALVLLGKVYLRLGSGAAAEEALDRARQAGADHALILMPLARAYMDQGKYELVLSEVRPGSHSEKLRAEILTIHGEAHLALLATERAKESFEQARALDGLSAGPRVGLARIALAAGHTDVALAHTAKAVLVDSRSEKAWFMDGEVRRIRGDLEGALASYGKSLALAPRDEQARISRAATLIDLGQTDAARADIENVRTNNAKQPQAAYLEAMLLARDGKLDEAQAILTETAGRLGNVDREELKKSAAALLLAGVVAEAQGHLEQARAHLEAFLAIEPEHALARRQLGAILVRQGEGQLAVAVLRPALESAPDDATLHATLGIAYRQARRYAESIASLEKAAALSPDAAGLRVELARSRLAGGQRRTGVRELEVLARQQDAAAAAAGRLLGQYHLAQGMPAAAVDAVRLGLERNPNDVLALLIEGDARLAQGDPVAATASFERALEIEPDSTPARYGLANAALARGEMAAAMTGFEAMLEHDDGKVLALVGLARVARMEKRNTDAIRSLEKARAEDPRAVVPQLELVGTLLAQGDVTRALEAARQLESMAADDPRALEALAQTLLLSGDRVNARQAYRRAGLLEGATPASLTRTATALLRLDDGDGARQLLERALVLDPDYLPGHAGLVAVELSARAYADALTRARRVATGYPKRGLGPSLEGDVEMARGEFERAIKAYGLSLEREPSTAVVGSLYRARWQAGHPEAAVGGLEAWLSERPQDQATRRMLAGAYLGLGRLEEAERLHEELLGESSQDAELLNNLAWMYQRRGDARALATIERAHDLAPEQASILDTYGWILLESDRPEDALKVLRKAQTRASEDPWVRYHTALALDRLGRGAEARELLAALLATGEPFEEAAAARALLDRLSGG